MVYMSWIGVEHRERDISTAKLGVLNPSMRLNIACSMAAASQSISPQNNNESCGQDVSPFPDFAPIHTLRNDKPFP